MVRKPVLCVCILCASLFCTAANAGSAPKRQAQAKPSGMDFWIGSLPYLTALPYLPSSQDNWLGGTGNWSNSGSWSGGLPVQSSDVVINTGNDNVIWDTSANINSLTLGGASGSSMLADNVGNGYTMNIAGALTVNHSGTLYLGGFNQGIGDTLIANANSSNAGNILVGMYSGLQVNGDFTNSGTVTFGGFYGVSGSYMSVSGNLTNAQGGTISDNSLLIGNLNVGGSLNNSGQVSLSNLTIGGTLTNNATGYVEADSGGGAANLSNAGRMAVYNVFGVTGDATNSGSITVFYGGEGVSGGSMTVGGTLTNTPSGTITVTGYPGEQLSAHSVRNSGSIQLLGGGTLAASTVTNSGTIATTNPLTNYISVGSRFTNSAGGMLQLGGSGGDMARIANLINQGTVIVGNGNTLTVPVGASASGNALAGFLNSGSVLIQQGGTISSFGKYTQTTGQTTVDGHLAGIINFAGGSVYGNNGTISGSVTSNAAINFGDNPMTVGQLTFAGNFTQGANGSLTFDIASANQYDHMDITGQAHLNGTMNIDLLRGYVPQVGNMFQIMTFAGESGTFSNVVGLPINNQEHFTLQYNSTNLTLDVVSGPLSGLSALKNGGSSGEPFIQIAEAGSPSQLAMNEGLPQTTPEPGSLVLFGSGVTGILGWLRRKKARA